MESKLVLGDCIEKLKELDDCYVEAIITGMLRNAWLSNIESVVPENEKS